MFWRRRYREVTCTLCALAATFVVIILPSPTALDGPLLDLLIKAREIVFLAEDRPERSSVVVVALDKRSLENPDLAPYPRTLFAPVWASALDAVFEAGALAVGFDFLFSYSANQFLPNYDLPLLAALGKHREKIVLARSATTRPALQFLAALRNDEKSLGLGELVSDPDGSYRRVWATRYDVRSGQSLPSLAGALLLRAKGVSMPGEIVLAPRRHLEKIPTYALIDVLRCSKAAPEVLKQVFRNRIVLIGSTLPEEDRKISSGRFLMPQRHDGPVLHSCGLRRLGASVPESPTVPGVYLFAEAVDAVATGRVTATVGRGVVAGLTAVTAASGAIAGLFLTPWLAFAAIAASALLIFAVATSLLSVDIWLLVALPLVALVGAPVVAYVVRYLVEERTRRQIQNAFSHYLSPAIVDRLASDASALKLGGELREVTVIFADLSGFTALSGKVEPEVLTQMVNQYLSYVVEAVEATGGYVDKFIGDAVMAIWGAPVGDPSHAANAIRAAMAAAARIHQEKRSAEARGEKSFSVKIGLNSGPAVVGNVGTDKRYNYTAVGETVNVAARLEGVPAIYGCHIVVGPRTAELAKDEFLLRELDWIQVKGKETPLAIFEPITEREKATREQIAHVGRFAEALTHYRAMRFNEAYTIWNALAEDEAVFSSPHDGKGELPSNPSSLMAERARTFAANPPASPWDSVWILTSK